MSAGPPGIDARLLMGSSNPESEELLPDGGKGAVVVGPEEERWAGARIRRLAYERGKKKEGHSDAINKENQGGTDINHPIGHLAHAEASRMAELLLFLFAGVRVVRVTVEPGLEIIGGFLGEFTPLTLGAVDKG